MDFAEDYCSHLKAVGRYMARQSRGGEPCYVPPSPASVVERGLATTEGQASKLLTSIMEALSLYPCQVPTYGGQCYVLLLAATKLANNKRIYAGGVVSGRAAGAAFIDENGNSKEPQKEIRLIDILIFFDKKTMKSSIKNIFKNHKLLVIFADEELFAIDKDEGFNDNIIGQEEFNAFHSTFLHCSNGFDFASEMIPTDREKPEQRTYKELISDMRCVRRSKIPGGPPHDFREDVVNWLKKIAYKRIQEKLEKAVFEITNNGLEIDTLISGHIRACMLKMSEDGRKKFVCKVIEACPSAER